MARSKFIAPRLEPDYEVTLPCGCVHSKVNKVFKVRYCRRKRILFPLATGVVKTIEKKIELYDRLGVDYNPKTGKIKRRRKASVPTTPSTVGP